MRFKLVGLLYVWSNACLGFWLFSVYCCIVSWWFVLAWLIELVGLIVYWLIGWCFRRWIGLVVFDTCWWWVWFCWWLLVSFVCSVCVLIEVVGLHMGCFFWLSGWFVGVCDCLFVCFVLGFFVLVCGIVGWVCWFYFVCLTVVFWFLV